MHQLSLVVDALIRVAIKCRGTSAILFCIGRGNRCIHNAMQTDILVQLDSIVEQMLLAFFSFSYVCTVIELWS